MTAPLSDERLAEIRERAEKATKGPWRAGRADMQSYDSMTGEPFTNVYWDDPDAKMHMGRKLPGVIAKALALDTKSDATFIAHAREDVPALLAENAELRRDLKAMRPEIAKLRAALHRVRIMTTEDGGPCWCATEPHQPACAEARALLGEVAP